MVRGGFARSELIDRQRVVNGRRRLLIRLLEGFSLHRADAIAVTTPAIRESIAARYRLEEGRIWIVLNPIDIRLFQPGTSAEENAALILTVGRLAPEKNLPELLVAMKSVDGARLQVVGTGPDEHGLRLQAGANVEFLGHVPNGEIPGLLRKAQIFVLASHYEGSPKALLEAMACGKAVIGADSPGIREIIQDGKNGLLVAGDAGALGEAISRLVGDEALRSRLGAAARDYVERTNSQAASLTLENELLRDLVGRQ